jgi:hypothetical protein
MTSSETNGASNLKMRIALISAAVSLIVALISLSGTWLVTKRSEQSAIEIEKLRHKLKLEEDRAKAADQRTQVRYERLHLDRAAFIRSLYGDIVETERDLFDLLYNWRPIGIAPRSIEPKDVSEKVEALCLSTRKGGIYFEANMVKTLESLCGTFQSSYRKLELAIMKAKNSENPPQFGEDEFKAVRLRCSSARKALERELSYYLGVMQP